MVNNIFVNCYGAGAGFYFTTPSTDNYLMGDIDGDGEIEVDDSRLALQQAVGAITLSASQFALADVNGDGSVEVEDAQEIMQYAVGLISSFSLYS